MWALALEVSCQQSESALSDQSNVTANDQRLSTNYDSRRTYMLPQPRRTFLKQAAIGAAVLAYPPSKVLGANDRVRVGMIGVGDRGNDLLDQVVKVPNVDLVVMADVYSRRRDQAKSKVPNIQTLDDYRRLLDMKDIDGVIVASPLHIHARHFLDTLVAGDDFFFQKATLRALPEHRQSA